MDSLEFCAIRKQINAITRARATREEFTPESIKCGHCTVCARTEKQTTGISFLDWVFSLRGYLINVTHLREQDVTEGNCILGLEKTEITIQ